MNTAAPGLPLPAGAPGVQAGVLVGSLADLRAWAAAARPVFIVGPARSGTSMLLLALAQHPALFGLKGVHETFIFHRPKAVLADPVPGMLGSYLGGPAGVEGLRAWWATMAGINGSAQEASAPGPATEADDDLLRAVFHFAAQAVYPGRRALEKTPGHVNNLAAIFRIFPQARVLACVREPAGVMRSYRARLAREQALGKPPEAWAWLTLDEPALAQQLKRVAHALSQAGQRWPGQVFQVPYEWITTQPHEALGQICQFLGEDFDEALLQPRSEQGKNRVDPKLLQAIGQAPLADSPELGESALARLTQALVPWVPEAWHHTGPLVAVPPAASPSEPTPARA